MDEKMRNVLSSIQGMTNQDLIMRGRKCFYKYAIEDEARVEGVGFDDVVKELEKWEEKGYIKLYREEKCYFKLLKEFEIPGLFRHKPFSKKRNIESALGIIEAGFNRFLTEGQDVFSKDFVNMVLDDDNVKLKQVFDKFKEWEERGFIQIIGDEKEFIKVLKPVRDYSIRYHHREL